MSKRKICVVTGTRAEYGQLYWLMHEIRLDRALELQIIATGMHLSPEFGLTYQAIERDGFCIDEKVEMLLSSDTPVGIGKSIGLGTIGFADAFARLSPDIVVLFGDRYEVLAAAQAAMVARIPIGHLHGGEATEGLIDEAIRHAVTKMAHLHFVAADEYRRRVIQLGEHPERVFNFGTPGLDNIKKLKLLNRKDFEKSLDFSLGKASFLVTFHPVTLNKNGNQQKTMRALFEALDRFPQAKVIFTKQNSDTDGRMIGQWVDRYTAKQPSRCRAFTSLGQLLYLSAMKHTDVVIGNSSSGVIEAPAMKKPSINIGDRQRGRLKAASVIDTGESTGAIVSSIKKALSPEFRNTAASVSSLYGEGGASYKIKECLKSANLDGILMKKFFNCEICA